MSANNPNRICVFTAGAEGTPEIQDEARRLGELIGQRGFDLVYGGFDVGTMGLVAHSAKDNGAEVIGVIPGAAQDPYSTRPNMRLAVNDRTEGTRSLAERKNLMFSLSGATIVLPGGVGTFGEIGTAIEERRRLIMVNTDGYYNALKEHFNTMHLAGLASAITSSQVHFAENALEAIDEAEKQIRKPKFTSFFHKRERP